MTDDSAGRGTRSPPRRRSSAGAKRQSRSERRDSSAGSSPAAAQGDSQPPRRRSGSGSGASRRGERLSRSAPRSSLRPPPLTGIPTNADAPSAPAPPLGPLTSAPLTPQSPSRPLGAVGTSGQSSGAAGRPAHEGTDRGNESSVVFYPETPVDPSHRTEGDDGGPPPGALTRGGGGGGDAEEPVTVALLEPEANYWMPDNAIRTAKYNVLTFLPLNLFEQFRRLSNFYFLIVCIAGFIPGASPFDPYSNLAPLVFVLASSAIKAGIEDVRRHMSDRRANSLQCTVVRPDGKEETIESHAVRCGDILKLRHGEEIRADCVLLCCSGADGVAYIETCNLDGETSAKPRRACPATRDAVGNREEIATLAYRRGVQVVADAPNYSLVSWKGKVVVGEAEGRLLDAIADRLADDAALPRGSGTALSISERPAGSSTADRAAASSATTAGPNQSTTTAAGGGAGGGSEAARRRSSAAAAAEPLEETTLMNNASIIFLPNSSAIDAVGIAGAGTNPVADGHNGSASRSAANGGAAAEGASVDPQLAAVLLPGGSRRPSQRRMSQSERRAAAAGEAASRRRGSLCGGCHATACRCTPQTERLAGGAGAGSPSDPNETSVSRRRARGSLGAPAAPPRAAGVAGLASSASHMLRSMSLNPASVPALLTDAEEAEKYPVTARLATMPPGPVTCGVDMTQFLPRGAVLRNTKWAYAAVVYTGVHTKLFLNLRQMPAKFSHLDAQLNKFILSLFAINALVVLVLAALATVWRVRVGTGSPQGLDIGAFAATLDPADTGDEAVPPTEAVTAAPGSSLLTGGVAQPVVNDGEIGATLTPTAPGTPTAEASINRDSPPWYAAPLLGTAARSGKDQTAAFFRQVLTFFVLMSYMVPISLFVIMEFIKATQAFIFMARDHKMSHYDPHRNEWRFCRPKTSDLNDQLAHVRYIFSDKTGTLTENSMNTMYIYGGGQVHDEGADQGGLTRLLGPLHSVADGGAAGAMSRRNRGGAGGSAGGSFKFCRSAVDGSGAPRPPLAPHGSRRASGADTPGGRLPPHDMARLLSGVAAGAFEQFYDDATAAAMQRDLNAQLLSGSLGEGRLRMESSGEHHHHGASHSGKRRSRRAGRSTGGLADDRARSASPGSGGVSRQHTTDTSFTDLAGERADGRGAPAGAGSGSGTGTGTATVTSGGAAAGGAAASTTLGRRGRGHVRSRSAHAPGELSLVALDTSLGRDAFIQASPVSAGGAQGLRAFDRSAGPQQHVPGAQPAATGGALAGPLAGDALFAPAAQLDLLLVAMAACHNVVVFDTQPWDSSLGATRKSAASTGGGGASASGKPSVDHAAAAAAATAAAGKTSKQKGKEGKAKPGSPAPAAEAEEPAIVYEGQSPDEIALVNTARRNGYKLASRTTKQMVVEAFDRQIVFDIIAELEFDPTRKLMSILVCEVESRNYFLLSKGADTSMAARMDQMSRGNLALVSALDAKLRSMAEIGLRTLVFGARQISEAEAHAWTRQFLTASAAMENREEEVAEAYAAIERDFVLLGATGVEDRLQEKVPETVAAMREAGIVVWMLTGDKRETACTIAATSSVVDPARHTLHHISVDRSSAALALADTAEAEAEARGAMWAECEVAIAEAELLLGIEPDDEAKSPVMSDTEASGDERGRSPWRRRRKKRNAGGAAPGGGGGDSRRAAHRPLLVIVIDGESLKCVLENDSGRFVRLAMQCVAAVGCRLTPLQKSECIRLFQQHTGYTALAIGDGANDVSMIQVAKVGIGVMGVEGSQAELAADYAIPRFMHLRRLLLVHGRFAWYRNTQVILYNFYKGILLGMVLAGYNFFAGLSGTTPIDSWLMTGFNTFFTSFIPLALGMVDQDIPAAVAEANPRLYRPLQRKQLYFNRRAKLMWLFAIVSQFSVIFSTMVISMYAFDLGNSGGDGGQHLLRPSDSLVHHAAVLFFVLALVVDVQGALIISRWDAVTFGSVVVSIVAAFGFSALYAAIRNFLGSSAFYFVFFDIMETWSFTLGFLDVVFLGALGLAVRFIAFPPPALPPEYLKAAKRRRRREIGDEDAGSAGGGDGARPSGRRLTRWAMRRHSQDQGDAEEDVDGV